MSLADYLFWKSLQPTQILPVRTVPFGHLVTIPKWNNDAKGPTTGFYWKILYGFIHHVTGTETQVYLGPKNDPTSAYVQIAVMLLGDADGDQNFFPIGTFSLSGTSPPGPGEYILDDSMMITHKGDANGYARMVVWEWETSKQFRL